MSMITELIERLRTNANWLDEEDNDERAIRKSMLEAADTIQFLSEKLHASQMERSSQYYHSGWIPVSESLPKSKPEDLEYPTVIICLSDGTVELGCFYESTKEWGAGENFDRLRNPMAWMPLPEPWKEEE